MPVSRKTASPPAMICICVRGTARRPSGVTSKVMKLARRGSRSGMLRGGCGAERDIVERRHPFRHVAAEHADMADRKRFGGCIHRDLGVIDAVDPHHADDAARADPVQRVGQFRLTPELRQQRHHQPGAHGRQHGQRRLDRVRQLDCDDRSRRQPRIEEMRGEVGDGAIRLRVGQPPRRLPGHALLVDRIGERVGVRLAGDAAAEQVVERRRARHGLVRSIHHVTIPVWHLAPATRFQEDCRSAPSVSAVRRASSGQAIGPAR